MLRGYFMAEKYCVFLRGINVGGVRMKMDELKKAFAAMSFRDAKTVLATGNVIVSAAGGPEALKQSIEASLGSFFSYPACVFLRSAAQLRSVAVAAKSFAVPAGCHLYYLVCDSRDAIAELAVVFQSLPHMEGEAFRPLDTGAFWSVPAGGTLDSAFGSKILGDKKFKDLLTSRNMNTVEKIVLAMGE
jgi:uncharacterized protein (DUF1697 family)